MMNNLNRILGFFRFLFLESGTTAAWFITIAFLLPSGPLFSQCTPNISISGGSVNFCVSDNLSYTLSADVLPPRDTFTGIGVVDTDNTDHMATWSPAAAGVGVHTITYVVQSDGGGCLAGNLKTIILTVYAIPDAGSDSTAFVCNETGASINLWTHLSGSPQTSGSWNTVSGVTPGGYLGALSDTDIATLGAGMHTFTYTVSGIAPCVDSSANVVLTITDMPMPSGLNAISAVCAGDSAMVTVAGLDDGNYTIEYAINGVSQNPVNTTSAGLSASFFTGPLSLANNGDNLSVTEIIYLDVTPNCSQTMFLVQPLTVYTQPSINARDTSFCDGQSVDLSNLLTTTTAGDGAEYGTVYGDYSLVGTLVSPTVNTTYYIRDSIDATGCVDTAVITVNVDPQPLITGRDTTICNGESVDLSMMLNGTAQNTLEYATNYGFFSVGGNVVTPGLGSTTYYIRDSSSSSNCVDTARVVITVNTEPVIAGRDTSICSGQSVDLSLLLTTTVAGDGPEYGTALGSYGLGSSTVSPGVMTTYYIRDSIDATGCVDTTVITVNVDPQPLITGRDTTICNGESVDLSMMLNGTAQNTLEYATNYGFFSVGGNVVTPGLGSTTYYIRDSSSSSNCVDTARVVITVNTEPVIAGRDTSICSGQSVDLSLLLTTTVAGDGPEYGTALGSYGLGSSMVSPGVMTTYYIRDSIDATGCVDTTVITVNVDPQPLITGRDTTICNGESVDLSMMLNGTAQNTLEYATNYGFFSVGGNVVTPGLGSTTYYIRDSSSSSNCVDTARVVITVNTEPVIAGRDTSICSGQSVDLSLLLTTTVAGDGPEYGTALGSYGLGSSMVSPGVMTTYYIRDSIDATGCVDTTVITVNVDPQPLITGRDTTICNGESVDLSMMLNGTAQNTLEYATNYGFFSVGGNVVTPGLGSTTYYIRDSSSTSNCVDTARVIITVNSEPVIAGRDTSICSGQSVDLSLLLTTTVAGDGPEYGTALGSYGLGSSTVSPGVMTTYYVRDSIDATGCVDTTVITVNVDPQPLITGRDTAICNGESVDLDMLLNGSPINTLQYGLAYGSYSPGGNLVSPAPGTTTYFIRDSSAATGCTDTAMISVHVSTLAVSVTGLSTVCENATITLTANGTGGALPYADTVWISANPGIATVDTIGRVTGIIAGATSIQGVIIDANGCRDTSAGYAITVSIGPTAGNIIGANRVCMESTLVLSQYISGGTLPYTVNWSSSDVLVATVDPNGIVSPLTIGTTDITYSVTDNNSCMAVSAVHTVTVDSLPVPVLTSSDGDNTICMGDAVTFTASGGDTYEFLLNELSLGAASATTTYLTDTLKNNDSVRVIVINSLGCRDTSGSVIMTVNPLPDASLTSDDADNYIGTGQKIIFTGSGIGTGPFMYQFLLNGNALQGPGTIDTFAIDTLAHLDTVLLNLTDANNCLDTASLVIRVNAIPTAVNDTLTLPEDTAMVVIDVQANDTDPEADLLTTAITNGAVNGIATVLNGDSVQYIPALNFNGMDSLKYSICDSLSNCDTATIYLTITPVNDKPVALDDAFIIAEDGPLDSIDVQINDSDVDGDQILTTILTAPGKGTAQVLLDSLISYLPKPDSNGVDAIVYQICDPLGLCDTGLVIITITPVNDPPIAVDDYVVTTQDTVNAGINPLINDTDIDDTQLKITAVSTTANGSATINTAMDSVFYTPMPGFSGLDTIEYTVCDTSNTCDMGMIFLTVGFVNTPPVAVNDTFTTVQEDTVMVLLDVLNNDSDVNGPGDSLKLTVLTSPVSGATATIMDDTLIKYIPVANFNGADSLQYTVCDTSMACATAWVFITVVPVNDRPVAVDDTVYLNIDTTNAILSVQDNDSDIDGDPLSVSLIGNSSQGVTPTVVNDSIRYSAPMGFLGLDTVTYRVFDGALYDTALLIIFIADPNNIPPIANTDFITVNSGSLSNIDVQANDTDPNGDALVTSIISGPYVGNAAIVLNGDSILYAAAVAFVGMDTIVYQVCDPSLTCDTDTVFITVENTLSLSITALLEGNFDPNTGLMHDSLRKLNYLPATEPYTNYPSLPGAYQFVHKTGGGGETITNPAAVLADKGANSIVDWVYLELLTAADTMPVASRAALLQRNGLVVDVDGTSPINFTGVANGNYFVSIRHRNHLGVMTNSPLALTAGAPGVIDFSVQGGGGTPVYGTHAMDTVGARLVLWAGDGNADRKIIFDGISNDKDPVFFDVLSDPLNTGNNYNHISFGYKAGDYDMKGSSIYLGSGNDPDIIFFNVFLHPDNGIGSTIFIIREQIPR